MKKSEFEVLYLDVTTDMLTLFKDLFQKNKITEDFTASTKSILSIYETRLGFLREFENVEYLGMQEVVENLSTFPKPRVRLIEIQIEDCDLLFFVDPEISLLLGVILLSEGNTHSSSATE